MSTDEPRQRAALPPTTTVSRRTFLGASGVIPAAVLFAAVRRSPAQAGELRATPACRDGDPVTPSQFSGPYYKPSSPLRTSLREAEIPGTPMILVGTVRDTRCRPLPGALLDFWQADAQGRYDTAGFRLRGHQFTDDAGRYRLETIASGLYPGRTRHLHVKAQAPNHPSPLTTQLYYPGEPANRRDFLFDPALVMTTEDRGGDMHAVFDFVLDVPSAT